MKAQDVLVALRLAAHAGGPSPSYPQLANELGMSASEAHAAVRRAVGAGLLAPDRSVRRSALLEFLVHGLKYVFPAERLGLSRGVPTSLGAPPLSSLFRGAELPPVWPHPEGSVRGEGLKPLYPSAPEAARRDPLLHEWLALVDAVRSGRARERELAVRELEKRLA